MASAVATQTEHATARASDPAEVTRAVFRELFGPADERGFAVRLWDGSVDGPADGSRFTLVLRRPEVVRQMLLPPSELAIGEAYLRDGFDIEGDVEAATALADEIAVVLRSPVRAARLLRLLLKLPAGDDELAAARDTPRLLGRRHTRRRDRVAVRSHYDVGNDFYALWLDRRMVYSCAYFPTGAEDLDAAQEAKLDHICRKLRLRPGQRLLDVGCGWGGLVIHAAGRYGVRALGITLSEPQARLANERIAAAGLADRCRVEVRDYRDLPRDERFDRIASVGMIEHVGKSRLGAYFAEMHRLLEPGGLFLNHGIVREPWGEPGGLVGRSLRLLWHEHAFVNRHVFPDGELAPLGEVVLAGERAGLEPRDVESLREHHARTLRYWVRRLEARHGEATALVGEPTYRVWRLYMAGSAHGFASGRLNVAQTLFARPAVDGTTPLPPTRADLYQATYPIRTGASGNL